MMINMRPTYETTHDLTREQAVAEKLTQAWGCEVVKTPPKTPYDYCALRDGLVSAIVEIKVRNNKSNKYPTFMLSLDKVSNCSLHSGTIGCPLIIVVQYTDKLKYWMFNKDDYSVGIGGRTDRGDSQDVEPVIYVPINKFKVIGE